MAGPLNILVVTEPLEPCGVWTYTEGLVKGLEQLGHTASVLTPGGSLLGRVRELGGPLFVERGVHGWWGRRAAVRRTLRALDGARPDVVHSLSILTQSTARRIAATLGVVS